jgi:hypothetical protein
MLAVEQADLILTRAAALVVLAAVVLAALALLQVRLEYLQRVQQTLAAGVAVE